MTFDAHEYRDMIPTGVVRTQLASSHKSAVEGVLYTERLRNGKAFVGPTGCVVYNGPFAYAVVPSPETKRAQKQA